MLVVKLINVVKMCIQGHKPVSIQMSTHALSHDTLYHNVFLFSYSKLPLHNFLFCNLHCFILYLNILLLFNWSHCILLLWHSAIVPRTPNMTILPLSLSLARYFILLLLLLPLPLQCCGYYTNTNQHDSCFARI